MATPCPEGFKCQDGGQRGSLRRCLSQEDSPAKSSGGYDSREVGRVRH